MSRTVTEPPRRRLGEFRRTRAVTIKWLALAVASFFAAAYGFGALGAAIRGASLEPIVIPAAAAVGDRLALSAIIVAGVIVLHELLHGAFMARYADAPTFGVGVSSFLLPDAYARTEDATYARDQLLVVLLAPFVCLSALGLLALAVFPTPLVVVPLAANAAGSVGDLWMAGVLLRYPAAARVAGVPEGQGFAVYGSRGVADRRSELATLSALAAGAVGTFALTAAALVALVFHSLAFGAGTVVVALDDRWLLFRHELRPGGGAILEVGAGLWVALSLAGGTAWALCRTALESLE